MVYLKCLQFTINTITCPSQANFFSLILCHSSNWHQCSICCMYYMHICSINSLVVWMVQLELNQKNICITRCRWSIITHFQQSQPRDKHVIFGNGTNFTLPLGLKHCCPPHLGLSSSTWFQTHDTLPIAFPHVAVWLACKRCILFKFTNCSHHLEWIKWNLHIISKREKLSF